MSVKINHDRTTQSHQESSLPHPLANEQKEPPPQQPSPTITSILPEQTLGRGCNNMVNNFLMTSLAIESTDKSAAYLAISGLQICELHPHTREEFHDIT